MKVAPTMDKSFSLKQHPDTCNFETNCHPGLAFIPILGQDFMLAKRFLHHFDLSTLPVRSTLTESGLNPQSI